MENIILGLVIILIVSLAGIYIYRSRKKGVNCIGCPDSKSCQGNCPGCTVKTKKYD